MYEQSEREIFEYAKWADGKKKQIKADPTVLHRKLLRAVGSDNLQDIITHMGLAYPEPVQAKLDAKAELTENDKNDLKATDAIVFAATEKAVVISCKTFGMQPLDDEGNGDLEPDILGVLIAYLQFLDAKKKREESSPTCLGPTAPDPLGTAA